VGSDTSEDGIVVDEWLQYNRLQDMSNWACAEELNVTGINDFIISCNLKQLTVGTIVV
jgi:hypothetical protein